MSAGKARAGKAKPETTVLEDVATALLWPPAEYFAGATWCPHCAFPLSRRDHHRHCIGYLVGTPDLTLCSCPCNEARRAAAAERKPDPRTDRPQWWRELPAWRGPA